MQRALALWLDLAGSWGSPQLRADQGLRGLLDARYMASSPGHNLLIEALPTAQRSSLLSQLEEVAMPLRTPLFEADSSARYVHFLLSGVASVVTTMQSGEAVEVGVFGFEGFPERIHLLGPQLGATRCFMQISGSALRMPFRKFQTIFQEDRIVQSTVHRFLQQDTLVLAQLGACNRLHEIRERLARWLLMVHDRTGELALDLTQEFLGEMLGARRSSVNLAATSLQHSGLISYSRGRILIEDLAGLEDAACECYSVIHKLFQSLYN